MASPPAATPSKPVIKCDSVYKIFGESAERLLREANGKVDAKAFQDAGCVVGVNNASFEVYEGEMLVVMGLSGSGKSTLLRLYLQTDGNDGWRHSYRRRRSRQYERQEVN